MAQRTSHLIIAGAAVLASGAWCGAQQLSPDEVRATVAEMIADAQSRSSLLGAESAGHDGSFFMASDDGAFRLAVSGFFQFRYDLDFRDDESTLGSRPGDDFTSGFQMRRMKLGFTGRVAKDWSYRVLLNTSRSNGSAILQDAYVDYALSDKVSIRMGQLKIPLLREELVEDSRQLAAERSLVNSAFTQDRSQGVVLTYDADPLNFKVGFSDGLNSDNTDFPGSENAAFIVAGQADWALTARVEYLLSGQPKLLTDFTAEPDQPFAAMVGGAVHYQQSPNSNAAGDLDRDTLQYTVDLSLEGAGWNFYGAFIGRSDEFRALGSSATFDDFAAIAQAGIRLDKRWEPFVRWEAFFFDSDRGLDTDDHHFLTVGVNNYISGHAVKATMDVVFPFDDTTDLVSLGILPDTGTGQLGSSKAGEVTVRFQLQLLF